MGKAAKLNVWSLRFFFRISDEVCNECVHAVGLVQHELERNDHDMLVVTKWLYNARHPWQWVSSFVERKFVVFLNDQLRPNAAICNL